MPCNMFPDILDAVLFPTSCLHMQLSESHSLPGWLLQTYIYKMTIDWWMCRHLLHVSEHLPHTLALACSLVKSARAIITCSCWGIEIFQIKKLIKLEFLVPKKNHIGIGTWYNIPGVHWQPHSTCSSRISSLRWDDQMLTLLLVSCWPGAFLRVLTRVVAAKSHRHNLVLHPSKYLGI